jgi:hypothetical protein
MPKVPKLTGSRVVALPYKTKIYKFEKNRVYFVCAEGLNHEEIDTISIDLKDKGLNVIVTNFDIRSTELMLEELKIFRDEVDRSYQMLVEKPEMKTESVSRYDLLKKGK